MPSVSGMELTEFEKKRKAEEEEVKKHVDSQIDEIHRDVDRDEKKLQEAQGPEPGGGEPSGHS